MPKREFSEAEFLGKCAEYVDAYYLRSIGRMVFHHGGEGEQEFEGRKLLTSRGNIVLADLSWFKWEGAKQRFYWGDSKLKKYATLNRLRGEWQTGCDLKALDNYRLLSAETQKNCFMFFLHLRSDSPEGACPTGLFWASTAKLFTSKRAHVWRSNGMIYWDVGVFDLAAGVQDLYRIPKCAEYLDKIYAIIGRDHRVAPSREDE